MKITESLRKRRSYYNITSQLPVEQEAVTELVQELTELVPDAFNMKSSRIAVLYGKQHEALWDTVYDVFEGKVSHEKINGFRSGAGTILYFYDTAVVESKQKEFPRYADNFPGWALQSSGMLQISIWSGLREKGIGASLQHYNPVIDERVRTLFNLPETWHLIAQMPFGGIGAEPAPKEKEDISVRVFIKE